MYEKESLITDKHEITDQFLQVNCALEQYIYICMTKVPIHRDRCLRFVKANMHRYQYLLYVQCT